MCVCVCVSVWEALGLVIDSLIPGDGFTGL